MARRRCVAHDATIDGSLRVHGYLLSMMQHMKQIMHYFRDLNIETLRYVHTRGEVVERNSSRAQTKICGDLQSELVPITLYPPAGGFERAWSNISIAFCFWSVGVDFLASCTGIELLLPAFLSSCHLH